jgi:hypothetical protein
MTSFVEAMSKCSSVWEHVVEPGTTADTLVALLRAAIVELRSPGTTVGGTAVAASNVLKTFKLFPRRTANQVGSGSTYILGDQQIHRRTYMDSGGYNRIFRCEWVHDGGQKDKAVLRFFRHCNDEEEEEEDKMLLLAFVETFIQILLVETNCVVRVIAPIKVERVTDPGYDFGSVLSNPGLGTFHDKLMGRQPLTDGQAFGIFLLVLETLEQLQKSHKFVHRDCKSDNIMLVRDPGRTTVDAGNGVTYPVDECKIQLIDFGYSEFWLPDGERVASDAEDYLAAADTFNDSVDVTYLAYVMAEDNYNELRKCPKFLQMIRDIAGPLVKRVKKNKGYERFNSEERNEAFLKTIYKNTKHGEWKPSKLRKLIREKYWPPSSTLPHPT